MISAIETFYNNYRFRSRLEARWAVFFDALKILYRYELQGHRVGRGYLPDFYLPTLGAWFEVKPYTVSSQETEKAVGLCLGLKQDVFLAEGDPFFPYGHYLRYFSWDSMRAQSPSSLMGMNKEVTEIEHIDDHGYVIHTKFPGMWWWPIETKGWAPLPIPPFPEIMNLMNTPLDETSERRAAEVWDHILTEDDGARAIVLNRLIEAMTAARQARFEFGETPSYVSFS